jgi:hypothetical protein
MIWKRKEKNDQIPFDLPVNREIIFSNYKNIYKKGVEHRQRSLIAMLSFLKGFLVEGEEILLVTTGCSPVSFGERFWTGLNVFQLKCSLLIFTSTRVFHVPATKHYSYRNSIAHFFYADCFSIQMKRLTLVVKYKNGKKEKFHHIAVREEKKIKTLLKGISFEELSGRTQGRVHLCPRCTKELEPGCFICANCSLEFREISRAKKISLIYPGGGYFYTRHLFLGIADAVTELILIGLIILSIAGKSKGIKFSEWGVILFSFALVFEKIITVYHSNNFIKEYIPKEKDIKPLTDPQ